LKGIILAGGNGTRLYPLTRPISKHLLPIYDKPMIYYPLSTLMLAGIREILIISTSKDTPRYEQLLGDGSQIGLHLQYAVQSSPNGIGEAFILGEEFIGKDNVALILGDNIFYGHDIANLLENVSKRKIGATVLSSYVDDPERFGVVEFDKEGNVLSVEEKPTVPKSSYAVTGLYFYDHRVVSFAKAIKPSERGELEITSINQEYLKRGELYVKLLGPGFVWLDAGTHESLLEASIFIETIEKKSNVKISCIEEIAFRKGYITIEQLAMLAEPMKKNEYGKYLLRIVDEYRNKLSEGETI
jgi:glucose-1-phosphate thymidylyltransferase